MSSTSNFVNIWDWPQLSALDKAEAERRGKPEQAWMPEDFYAAHMPNDMMGRIIRHGDEIVGFMVYERQEDKKAIILHKIVARDNDPEIKKELVDRLKGILSTKFTDLFFMIGESDPGDMRAFLDKNTLNFKHVDTLPNYYTDTGENAYVVRYNVNNNYAPLDVGVSSFFARNAHEKGVQKLTPEDILRARSLLSSATAKEWGVYHANERGKLVPVTQPAELDAASRICYMTDVIDDSDRFNKTVRSTLHNNVYLSPNYGGVTRGIFSADELQCISAVNVTLREADLREALQRFEDAPGNKPTDAGPANDASQPDRRLE